jgi:hypothetical protein
MLGFARKASDTATATEFTPSERAKDIYQRHAARLYRQALVTLGDESLARQVLADALAAECGLSEVTAGGDIGCRLAVSVYWLCQETATRPGAYHSGPDVRERGALALVLFGGLEYRHASRALAIPPAEMAAILRTALHQLTATAGVSQSLPQT